MKKLACLVLSAVIMALSAGCASNNNQTKVNAIGQERYFLGTYSVVLANSMMALDKAVISVCSRGHLLLISKITSANTCDYVYKDINNVELRISLEERTDDTVKMKMKVGRTGDKISCQELYAAINEEVNRQPSSL